MANSTTAGNLLWTLDTRGVISETPIYIDKIILVPNAAGDTCTFVSWQTSGLHSTVTNITGTVSSNSIIGSTGSFVAGNVTALDVLDINASTGAAANLGQVLVLTRDSDDQITTVGKTLTNESSKIYNGLIYTPYTQFVLKSDATTGAKTESELWVERWVPNLALTVLTASATIRIYLR